MPKMKERKMRKFSGFKGVEELAKILKKKKWPLHRKQYDYAGSDFVSFDFKIKAVTGTVTGKAFYNTFNGQLYGKVDNGDDFTSQNTTHEDCPWFNELLRTVYK